MLVPVEATQLGLMAHAQSNDRLDRLEHDPHRDDCERQAGHDTQHLDAELAEAATEEAAAAKSTSKKTDEEG